MDTNIEAIESKQEPTLGKQAQGLLDKEKARIQLLNQMGFHNVAITEVKKRLGKNCTYLSHVVENGEISFKANLIVKEKSQTFLVTANKIAEDLVAEDYGNLNKVLNGYIS